MKICGGLLVAHGEILKYLFFIHNDNFVLPFEKSENTQYFLTTYLNQKKKKNKTNIKTILIKVLFAVYSCHLIDLYFYCFPESTDFSHVFFFFYALTSGGSVLFHNYLLHIWLSVALVSHWVHCQRRNFPSVVT